MGLNKILHCSIEYAAPPKGSYVYFLIDDEEVVYVGKTVLLDARVSNHRRDKVFTDVRYISVPEEKLSDTENALIRCLSPKYNAESHRRVKPSKADLAIVEPYLAQDPYLIWDKKHLLNFNREHFGCVAYSKHSDGSAPYVVGYYDDDEYADDHELNCPLGIVLERFDELEIEVREDLIESLSDHCDCFVAVVMHADGSTFHIPYCDLYAVSEEFEAGLKVDIPQEHYENFALFKKEVIDDCKKN